MKLALKLMSEYLYFHFILFSHFKILFNKYYIHYSVFYRYTSVRGPFILPCAFYLPIY